MFIQQEYYELQLVFEVTFKEGFSIGINDMISSGEKPDRGRGSKRQGVIHFLSSTQPTPSSGPPGQGLPRMEPRYKVQGH